MEALHRCIAARAGRGGGEACLKPPLGRPACPSVGGLQHAQALGLAMPGEPGTMPAVDSVIKSTTDPFCAGLLSSPWPQQA
eukprot:6658268-Lingulodinium_polyedra.AAC.1